MAKRKKSIEKNPGQITITLPMDRLKRLREVADADDRSISAVVRHLLQLSDPLPLGGPK